MCILFLPLLLLFCAPHPLTSTTTTTTHNRRTLHEPFIPLDSFPPSQPPSPQPPTPKIPFSTSTPDQQPFFPSFLTPPSPPSPTSFGSFPANISSLSLPQSPKPTPTSSKLIATAVASVLSAVAVVAIIVFLHFRKRRKQSSNVEKTYRSDTTEPNRNQNPRSPPTNSEFLYLGTVINSHSGVDSQAHTNGGGGGGGRSHLRKLDSPELHPLPPLNGQNHQQNSNVYVGPVGDEDDEEFYSPRGSVGGRDNSTTSGSGSRSLFAAVAARNFGGMSSGSSCSSYSSSATGSPVRSVSLSISPPVSLTARNSRPKSPELVAVQTAAPPSGPPPPPPPPHFMVPSVDKKNSQALARISGYVQQPVAVSIPPPPPPLPPPPPPSRQRESPTTPTPPVCKPISKPPVLITPSRPVVIQNPASFSPIELPQSIETVEKNEETPKLKLKALHWDKVRASSGREMVWDQLKSSSFKLNEEMIETLFVVNPPNSNSKETTRWQVLPLPNEENRVLDPKKSQNIAILLRAIHVTVEEVCEALLEGNTDNLGTDLLESLLKMAPTKEEERKLKEYKEDSPIKLGPAEKFLKTLLDIPFAFKRVDAMLYISNFDSEIEYLKKSFETLEAACEELRNSRMFLKLLEAVLKTGNRMNVGTNRGDAHAFKLDTLLKLIDVKGADGKTTLLHFVVQEIIRSEGARLSGAHQNPQSTIDDDSKCRKLGLQVVSGLSLELTNVKKAAAMDSEVLNGDVLKLSKGIGNITEIVRLNEAMDSVESSRRFSESMNRFVKMAEEGIIRIQAQDSVALSLVKEITEYFHGNSAKEEAHPFRIFMVVRDFLTVLDRVCKEVGMINERTIVSSAHKFPVPVNPTLPPVFSGFPGRQQYSSSDDESSSP